MNDYLISYMTKSPQDNEFKQMTASYTNRWYATSLAWLLEQQLRIHQQKQKVVVLSLDPSHFGPAGDFESPLWPQSVECVLFIRSNAFIESTSAHLGVWTYALQF